MLNSAPCSVYVQGWMRRVKKECISKIKFSALFCVCSGVKERNKGAVERVKECIGKIEFSALFCSSSDGYSPHSSPAPPPLAFSARAATASGRHFVRSLYSAKAGEGLKPPEEQDAVSVLRLAPEEEPSPGLCVEPDRRRKKEKAGETAALFWGKGGVLQEL